MTVFFESVFIQRVWWQVSDYVVEETSFGKVHGNEKRGIEIFSGILYDAGTQDVNRFISPVELVNWVGIRAASGSGHSAPHSGLRCALRNPYSANLCRLFSRTTLKNIAVTECLITKMFRIATQPYDV